MSEQGLGDYNVDIVMCIDNCKYASYNRSGKGKCVVVL